MFASLRFSSSPGRIAIGMIATACCLDAFAAESTQQKKSDADRAAAAKALVDEALTREIDGRDDERRNLLNEAAALDPDLPAAKWHRGMTLVDGDWTPAETIAAEGATDSTLIEYVAKRDAAQDTLRDQLALAQWCEKNGLLAQERAHLVRALKFDPDHPLARARLGFVPIDGEWISREEIARAFAEEAKAQASFAKYRGKFESLVRNLFDDKAVVRERAAETIRSIRDVNAIPALESTVAVAGEEASLLVLETLAQMPEKEATVSLARFAVFSPSYVVRDEAIGSLEDRDFDHFVPQMLASMSAPTQMEFVIERGRDGRLVYRETFFREAMHSAAALIRETVYESNGVGLSRVRGRALGAVIGDRESQADAGVRAAMSEAVVALADAPTNDLNARIGDVLDRVTGNRIGADAALWWEWWDVHNEYVSTGQKPVAVQYESRTVETPNLQLGDVRPLGAKRMSCFAAGTPVLTNRGDVAIEQVRVGDLVLAQDIETGELAFQPVLETTIRPASEILRVEHEQGSFRCTLGHPFWVSGEGWVHAKSLKSGMELHTVDGSVRISQIVHDGAEPAYNLIVDRFANYFADEARILSHDNSSRRPTDAVVPGLVQK